MSVHCQYNMAMLIQTLYKNGNSVAVTIPRQYLDDLDLKEGSEVVVEKKEKNLELLQKKKRFLQILILSLCKWWIALFLITKMC